MQTPVVLAGSFSLYQRQFTNSFSQTSLDFCDSPLSLWNWCCSTRISHKASLWQVVGGHLGPYWSALCFQINNVSSSKLYLCLSREGQLEEKLPLHYRTAPCFRLAWAAVWVGYNTELPRFSQVFNAATVPCGAPGPTQRYLRWDSGHRHSTHFPASSRYKD